MNWAEIFINVKTLHVSFLTRDDGRDLLTKPVPRLRYASESLVAQILDLTGCQPYLLQSIADQMISHLNSQRTTTVTNSILETSIDSVLSQAGAYFGYLWRTECSTEKHRSLVSRIVRSNSPLRIDDLTEFRHEIKDLVKKEVLCKEGMAVTLSIPLFKQWLEKYWHLV